MLLKKSKLITLSPPNSSEEIYGEKNKLKQEEQYRWNDSDLDKKIRG